MKQAWYRSKLNYLNAEKTTEWEQAAVLLNSM